MALSIKITQQWEDTKMVHVSGTLTTSGSYATGGDVVPFGNVSTDTYGQTIKSGSAPIVFVCTGPAYNINGVLGTTIANCKMQAYVDSTGLEVSAGAYPGGFPVVNFYAIFPKHQ